MNTKIIISLPIAYLFLVIAQSMVGVNIVGSKFLADSTPLFVQLGFRFLFATLLLLPLYWMFERKQATIRSHLSTLNRRDWFFIAAQALCSGALFNLLIVFGLRYTDANVAGIITSTLPALIAVLSWIFLKEKLTGIKAACVGFATAGLFLISINNVLHADFNHSLFGDLMIFLAMFPEALYYLLTKIYHQKIPLLLVSIIMNFINTLVLFPLMFLFIDMSTMALSPVQWSIIAIIGLGSGLFFIFWFLGADKVDSTMASLSTAVVPIATVIIAWLALGETISTLQLFGMSMVIISIMAYALSFKISKLPLKEEDDLNKESA